MIFAGSRYEQAHIVTALGADGRYHSTAFQATRHDVVSGKRTVMADEGARFDMLAYYAYGDPELWWVIANANPQIPYPDAIPVGAVITIPTITSLG